LRGDPREPASARVDLRVVAHTTPGAERDPPGRLRPGRRQAHADRHPWRRPLLFDLGALVLALGSFVVAVGRPDGVGAVILVAILPAWALAAAAAGLLDRDDRYGDRTLLGELVRVAGIAAVGAWAYIAVPVAVGADRPDLGRLVALWALVVGFLGAGRVASRVIRHRIRRPTRVLIIGAGTLGQHVASRIRRHPEYGVELVGFVDRLPARPDRCDVTLDPPDRLAEIISDFAVDRVIVADPAASTAETVTALRSLCGRGVTVDVVPHIGDAVGYEAVAGRLETVPLLRMQGMRLTASGAAAKRAVDLLLAIPASVVLLPVGALIGLLVRLDSRGPALFRQTRLGQDMRAFTSLKFRTMTVETGDDEHRAYIRATMLGERGVQGNGL
jgi:hypothetical protein